MQTQRQTIWCLRCRTVAARRTNEGGCNNHPPPAQSQFRVKHCAGRPSRVGDLLWGPVHEAHSFRSTSHAHQLRLADPLPRSRNAASCHAVSCAEGPPGNHVVVFSARMSNAPGKRLFADYHDRGRPSEHAIRHGWGMQFPMPRTGDEPKQLETPLRHCQPPSWEAPLKLPPGELHHGMATRESTTAYSPRPPMMESSFFSARPATFPEPERKGYVSKRRTGWATWDRRPFSSCLAPFCRAKSR